MSEERAYTRSRGWLMLLLGWALAFFSITAFYRYVLLEQENPNRLSVLLAQDEEIVLEKNVNGHYLAEGWINGSVVTFLIDTGATQVAIPQQTAERLRMVANQPRMIQTAAGVTTGWTTNIDELQLGFFLFHDLRGIIIPGMTGDEVLLGMNALSALHITQSGDTLKLKPMAETLYDSGKK